MWIKRALVFIALTSLCLFPAASLALEDQCDMWSDETIPGLDFNHGVDRLIPAGMIGTGALSSTTAPNMLGNRGFLVAVGQTSHGKATPMCWSYRYDGTLGALNQFNIGSFTPPTMDDIQDIQVINTRIPQGPKNEAVRVHILTQSQDSLHLITGDYYDDSGLIRNWGQYQLRDVGAVANCSLAGRDAGGTTRASVLCSDEDGIARWDIPQEPGIGGTITKDRIWFFGFWEKKVNNGPIGFAWDHQRNLHGAGVSSDGCLVYTKWDQDGTALEGGHVGDCNKDWQWVSMAVGPNDYLWISAYNGTSGNLRIIEKPAKDSPWSKMTIYPIQGFKVGMYDSLAVDPNTGTAYITSASGDGRTQVLSKAPGKTPQLTWLDRQYGQAVSSSTGAYDGFVTNWFMTQDENDDKSQLRCRTCPGE